MQNIIDLFAKQYGLTRNEVMAEIENVFSTVLSRWYRITYAGSLIDEFIYQESEQTYSLKLNPKLSVLFAAGMTQIQYHQRLCLQTSLAKWLHGFYASHKKPYSIKVATLKHLCGSDCKRLVDFRRSLRAAMDELVYVKAILDWQIDAQDKVHVQNPEENILK